jgi:hypothetical protein
MDEPPHVLPNGVKIVTNATPNGSLGSAGILVKKKYLEARRPNMKGEIAGFVSGHGGDVYWVRHENGQIATYGWWEFELDEEP